MTLSKSEEKVDQDLDLMLPGVVTSSRPLDSLKPGRVLGHTKLAAAASLRGLENRGFHFYLDDHSTSTLSVSLVIF
jgi:hypothetical protein